MGNSDETTNKNNNIHLIKDFSQTKENTNDEGSLKRIKKLLKERIETIQNTTFPQPYKYNFNKKESKKPIYEYLNGIAEHGEYTIPQQIPLTFGIVNLVVFILTFTVNANWIWLFYLNSLSLSIMEIRCAGTLERHVQRQHGVRININRFLLFFLQSLYFNYVLLTYEKRISDAKQYRRY